MSGPPSRERKSRVVVSLPHRPRGYETPSSPKERVCVSLPPSPLTHKPCGKTRAQLEKLEIYVKIIGST
jgi:hypothetical protein